VRAGAGLTRRLLLALSARPAVGEALERMPVTRPLVRRFVAGAEPEAALAVAEAAERRGLRTAVTYLGENVRTRAAAEAAADVYLEVLDEAKRRGLRCAPSVKLTQLGLDVDPALCLAQTRRIADRAGEHGITVWIDMEGSAYTEAALDAHAALRREGRGVACVIQAYLRRSEADFRALLAAGATVRLCKGAYREPADVAFTTRDAIDASYARLMDAALDAEARRAGAFTGFATHDARLIERVMSSARARAVPADAFELQMLYGVRAELHPWIRSRDLALRLLVPFGLDWYGYFMRRLAERPANLLFLLRSRGR